MRVLYLAHPVAGDVERNVRDAKRWWRWLSERFDVAIASTWVAEVTMWDDADPRQREAGLRRCMAILSRADGVLCVGPKISSGMSREMAQAQRIGIPGLACIGVSPEEAEPAIRDWLHRLPRRFEL